MPDPKLVVVDLAGTTIEDRGGIAEAFALAFATCGIRVTDAQLSAARGRSKRVAVAQILADSGHPQERAENIFIALQNAIRDVLRRDGIAAVAGAMDAIESLRSRGIRVALNTGFDRDTASFIVETLRWQNVVDAIVCGDDVREGRPAPFMIFRAMEITGTHAVAGVAAAGDTSADLQAGWNAGVRWNIAVLSGAHSRAQLEAAPHTNVVSSIRDVAAPGFFE